jgi:hypothetical protein
MRKPASVLLLVVSNAVLALSLLSLSAPLSLVEQPLTASSDTC